MKTCRACLQEKSFENFYKHPSTPDRKTYWCKACLSDYGKRYRGTPSGSRAVLKGSKSERKKEARERFRRSEKGRAYDLEYKNRDYVKAKAIRKSVERARKIKVWLDEIKLKSGCVECGYKAHSEALDFDHRDPETKRFTIARAKTRTKNILLLEIDKCDIVCANCHRVRTANRRSLK